MDPKDDIVGRRATRNIEPRSRQGLDHALPLLYDELRCMARSYLQREHKDHTLQPTALVHEAYLRLLGQRAVDWTNREQFLAAAATMMRRLLIDHRRARTTIKRGGNSTTTTLDQAVLAFEDHSIDLLELDGALDRLADIEPRLTKVIELRFFGGLSVEETARVLDVSVRTVAREWALARAWLLRELSHD